MDSLDAWWLRMSDVGSSAQFRGDKSHCLHLLLFGLWIRKDGRGVGARSREPAEVFLRRKRRYTDEWFYAIRGWTHAEFLSRPVSYRGDGRSL